MRLVTPLVGRSGPYPLQRRFFEVKSAEPFPDLERAVNQ